MGSHRPPILGVLFVMFCGAGLVSAAPYYQLTDLGTLGSSTSAALSINESGQVVGYSYDSSFVRRAFLYDNNTLTALAPLGTSSSVARDINDAGQVVGSSYVNNAYRAFLYSNGTATNLGVLSGDADSDARAINNNGQVVGTSRNFSYVSHAFLYSNGVMTGLGALAGDAESKAGDINESGQVVGSSTNSNNLNRAFLYDGGTMSDLGTLGGSSSSARDINNSGQVVGISETAVSGVYHAFLYTDGAMTDLKGLIDPSSQWNLKYATGINDSGSIVGIGKSPGGGWHGYILTPIVRPYAELSLPQSLSDLRMMQGSSGTPGNTSVGISHPGNTATSFTLSPTDVSLTASSGVVAPAAVTSVPFSFGWTDTSTTGARSGSIMLTNESDSSDLDDLAEVTGAVLANRQLIVAAIGSSSAPARILARASLTTTISSGSEDDDHATRVNTVANAIAKYGVATVKYSATQPDDVLPTRFDAPDQSASLSMSFSTVGHYAGNINLAQTSSVSGNKVNAFVADGEDASVGAQVQPAVLSYDVNVLQQRKLRTISYNLNLGNVLRGANVSTNFVVTSANVYPDSAHTTMVSVATGGTPLGTLTAGQTLVSDGGSVNVPLTGTLNTYGSVSVSGLLPVVTAEDESVKDTTPYSSLGVRYKANVGIAKFGTTPTSFGSGGTVLSASVKSGSTLTNLSSKVNPRNTLVENQTPASWVTWRGSLPAAKLYGAVGSEATIVDSTEVAIDTTISMQWRKRLAGEANTPGTPVSTALPAGCGWLTSDVVKISGVPSDVVYALQMTFDNRINLAFDGQTNGSVTNEFPGLYLAQLDGGGHWANAGISTLGHLKSLTNFLLENEGVDLADLVGNWGVDPVTNATGLGYSWTIVAGGGSGIFAVDPTPSTSAGYSHKSAVPEPSTFVLLISAGLGLLACGLWRRRPLRA